MKHRVRIKISEKRMGKRLLASVMAAVTASTAIAIPASAAPPRVQVDETMYVNLDYYGSETEINVWCLPKSVIRVCVPTLLPPGLFGNKTVITSLIVIFC